jgi:ferredoxin-nitrite reductase
LVGLARDYGNGELRFTESQNVLIVDVPTQRTEALLAEPLLRRFPSDPGPLLAEAVSCTGNHYCGLALIPTKSTALSVLAELEQRLVLPEEVAHAVLSLCMSGSDAINGQAIVIDGGELAG